MTKVENQPVPQPTNSPSTKGFPSKNKTALIAIAALFLALPLIVYAALTITRLNSRAYKPTTITIATVPTQPPTPTAPPPLNHPPIIFINNPVLPNGKVGKIYSAKIDTVGTNGDQVAITSIDGLPAGIKRGPCQDGYNFSECLISGTPSTPGKFSVRVKAKNKENSVIISTFALTINP